MPKILKWLLVLASVGLVVVGLGAWWFAHKVSNQPRAWRSEAVVDLVAPPALVFEEIVDFQRWQQWSGWSRDVEPEVRRSYAGVPKGTGMILVWDAGTVDPKVIVGGPVRISFQENPDGLANIVGKGTVRIVSADPTRGVELETVYEKALWLAGSTKVGASVVKRSSLRCERNGADFVTQSHITLEPTPTGTRVRWVEEGTFGEGFAAGTLAMAMRGMVEERNTEILSSSLEGLKMHVETPR